MWSSRSVLPHRLQSGRHRGLVDAGTALHLLRADDFGTLFFLERARESKNENRRKHLLMRYHVRSYKFSLKMKFEMYFILFPFSLLALALSLSLSLSSFCHAYSLEWNL